MQQVGFGIIALCLLASALSVVTSKNLVHCVLWLAVTLVSTAVLYVFLEASFLAAIQVLLYTGGVITLMLFGVMLTRHDDRAAIENETTPGRRLPALLTAGSLFAVLALAVLEMDPPPDTLMPAATTDEIGRSFLTEHLLAFEVLSVLLLAAMIGAIVLARRHDFGAEPERGVRRKGSAA